MLLALLDRGVVLELVDLLLSVRPEALLQVAAEQEGVDHSSLKLDITSKPRKTPKKPMDASPILVANHPP